MEKILSILKDLRPEINFEEETALIDNGLLDSFDIVALVGELNEAFSVEIGVEDLLPENFNSVSDINKLIIRLTNGE